MKDKYEGIIEEFKNYLDNSTVEEVIQDVKNIIEDNKIYESRLE